MEPVADNEAVGEWEIDDRFEVLTVEKSGLEHFDYLFGCTIPHSYNWKSRTFALGSRFEIDRMVFCYDLEFQILKLEVSQSMANR